VSKPLLTIDQIRALLPHRFPMLLVDRVLNIGEADITGVKMVSANEPFFQGHFPSSPVMPGVLILEALAQVACIWVLHTHPDRVGLTPALTGIDKARFRRPVRPGDLLELHARVDRVRESLIRVEAEARVDGETAATAMLLASFVDWSGAA
jgi:3-hydroxyacyl-[acyl-carrier-protein] dehydratase